MPPIKPSRSFPGVSSLPAPIKGLVEFFTGAPEDISSMAPSPAAGVGGLAAPLISVFKNKAARTLGTSQFLKSAVDTGIHGIDTAAELFAGKYPRVAAHMRLVKDKSYGLPMMAQTKSPYGKVKEPIDIALSEDMPYPLNLLTHEGTHVAQSLGNSDALKLYDLANDHAHIGYPRNPFEHTADWAGDQAEAIPRYAKTVFKRPPNAIKALRGLATSSGSHTAPEMLKILDKRAGK